jgi:hypothetical protein
MADKTPIRLVLDGSNPTGIAEYQSGETIPVASGGTGLSSLGTAGYFLRTNEAGTALEYASVVSQFTLTGDDSSDVTFSTGQTLRILGDTGITAAVTDAGDSGAILTIDLDDTAVTPGSYGSSTAVPQITVDQQGRITSLSTAAISTSFTLAADSGSNDTFNTGDTLTISGTSNEIETAVTDNTITIGLPDDITVGNNLTVTGNLTVNGTTTTLSTTNTTVEDQLFELGNGRTGSATGDSGIIIERGDDSNVFIGYDESADKITFGTGTFTGASTGDLTLTDSDIRVSGIEATGDLDVTGTSTLSGNIVLGTGDGGDSSTNTIIVNGRIASDLIPSQDSVYNLGRADQRWKTIFLAAETLDIGGATISSDGSGSITISGSGAVLPVGSKLGDDTIAAADSVTGLATRKVNFFTNAGGLSSANTQFTFAATSNTSVFKAFTRSNGSAQAVISLFTF